MENDYGGAANRKYSELSTFALRCLPNCLLRGSKHSVTHDNEDGTGFDLKTNRSNLYVTLAAMALGIAIGCFIGYVWAIHWALSISPWQAVRALWHGLDDGYRFTSVATLNK